MSKIVLTTIGSLGDLYPQIAIAIELRQQGYQIVFAAMKEYGTIITQLGFEFQPMRPDATIMEHPDAMAGMKDAVTGAEYGLKHLLMPNLRDTYTDLLACSQGADLIIAGAAVYAAPLVAEKLDIPWISLALAPFAFFSIADPSVPLLRLLDKLSGLGMPANKRMINLCKAVTKPWAEPIYQLRSELNLSPIATNPLVDLSSAALVLAMFSPVFAPPQLDWEPNTVVTGFPFYDSHHQDTKLSPELQAFLAGGEPPIVFTLGSAVVLIPGTFYPESIQATIQLNRRAVLLIGANPPPQNLPEGIIAIDYVPHSLIFPHACAIVHQGGIGTTAQALKAGRPTLIMPYSEDQPDNAARAQRLGTSRTISRQEYTATRVAQELQELIVTDRYAIAATAISQIIQAESGVKLACHILHQYIQTTKSRDPSESRH